MPLKYKQLFLAAIVLSECVISIVVVRHFWFLLKEGRSVLGMHTVARIPKESLVFPKSESLSYYYEPKPNGHDLDWPDWLTYKVTDRYNSDGMRDDKEYAVEKPPNVFRIMTLGDSFTFGMYVNVEDNYPTKLANILNNSSCGGTKFEVINLGVPGYDLEYTVEHFRRRGQKYQPDLVVWLINEHNVWQLRDIIIPMEEKIRNETSKDEKQSYYAQHKYYFAVTKAQEQLKLQYGERYIFVRQNAAFDTFSELYKGPLILYMLPQPWSSAKTQDFVNTYSLRRPDTYFDRTLPDIGLMNGLFPDGHPNAKGHAALANAMYQYLLQERLVPCRQ